MLLANNVLLMVAAGSVLLGTLYPLFIDALELGKISVGPPYFEAVFVPLMAPGGVPDGPGTARALETGKPAGTRRALALGIRCERDNRAADAVRHG